MWSGSCRFLKRSSVCLLSLTRPSSREGAGHNCVAEPVHKMRWYGRGDDKGKRGWQNRADVKHEESASGEIHIFPLDVSALFSLRLLFSSPSLPLPPRFSFAPCLSFLSASLSGRGRCSFIRTRKVGYRLYGVEGLFNEMFDMFSSDEIMVQYVPPSRDRFDACASSLRNHIVFSKINVSIGGFAGNWISSRKYRNLNS